MHSSEAQLLHFMISGLSVSYDRIQQIEKSIATSLCQQFQRDGAVVPRNLKKSTFVLSALDNIDHNPSGNLSMDSFHGTSITMHQHPTNTSVDQEMFQLTNQSYKIELPSSYSIVESIEQENEKTAASTKVVTYPIFDIEQELNKERQWAEHSGQLLTQTSMNENDKISWEAYFSEKQTSTEALVLPAEMAIFPLFQDKAASLPMVKQSFVLLSKS